MVWTVYMPDKKQWTSYEDEDSDSIEEQFHLNNGTGTITITIDQRDYLIDFDLLEQKNKSTGFTRGIDRLDSNFNPLSSLRLHRQNGKYLPGQSTDDLVESDSDSSNSNPKIIWEFFDRSYQPYNDSDTIEKAYQADKTGTTTYSYGHHTYTINFSKMEQMNVATKVIRAIRRIVDSSDDDDDDDDDDNYIDCYDGDELDDAQSNGQLSQAVIQHLLSKFTQMTTKTALSYVNNGAFDLNTIPMNHQLLLKQRTSEIYSNYLNQQLTAQTATLTNSNINPNILFNQLHYPLQPDLEIKLKQILTLVPTKPNFQQISFSTLDLEEFSLPPHVDDLTTPSPNSSFTHNTQCSICHCDCEHHHSNTANEDNVIVLACQHVFHITCLKEHLISSKDCPNCRTPITYPVGPCPNGTITLSYNSQPVPGEDQSVGNISISMSISGGVQDHRHRNQGVSYSGDHRNAYIPATPQGFDILLMFIKAFITRFTFTVGFSPTRNVDNVVAWALHCKTSLSGGAQNYGFPDPEYYKRTTEDLKSTAHVSLDTM